MTALIIARSYKAERLICILHNECTGIYIKFGLIQFSYKNFMQQKLYMKTIFKLLSLFALKIVPINNQAFGTMRILCSKHKWSK